MNTRKTDPFGARATLTTPEGAFQIYRLDTLARSLGFSLERMPFSIRILIEAALRNCDGFEITEDDVKRLAHWTPSPEPVEIPFKPARVILQDFTGVPCVVDLAAMRDAVQRLGGDPKKINPLVPVDLVIDHSVQVDVYGNVTALERNAAIEFERNKERYEFLRWGQKAFQNFRVVPPATGIVHQVNLEYLASGTVTAPDPAGGTAMFPDSLVGTDSHTTMINGLGVMGWGVGGIEAEAVMLGQALYMVMPHVVGFKLTGSLKDGVTATDLVLTVTQMLRKRGVVDKFVEFYGPGLSAMSVADRATIGNMAPEYGATMGFFPVDAETLRYFERTARVDQARRLERYAKEQGLFRTDDTPEPEFSDTLSLELGDVEPCLAGPKRPQDRVALREMKQSFEKSLVASVKERGYGLGDDDLERTAEVPFNGHRERLGHGAVVIAAITSCTNTSNPSVMVAAGLVAQKAAARGLKPKPYVKTSMAPGSKVVTEYLREAGLIEPLEALGFNTVGYGCTTCIAAGTPVLLADGTARRIEQMPREGGAHILGPTPERRLQLGVQSQMMVQGIQECVELELQDGRTLVCTSDHEILCAGGTWKRAGDLALGRDRVVVGLETPLDERGDDEDGYTLHAVPLRFVMENEHERSRILAFARLVGYLYREPSAGLGPGRVRVHHALDAQLLMTDIERITGKQSVVTRGEGSWDIELLDEVSEALHALLGAPLGSRIHRAPTLPAFVLHPDCPLAIVREFIGGLFGANGRAPALQMHGAHEAQADLAPIAYSQCIRPEHGEALRRVMVQLVRLLARCGVQANDTHVSEYPKRSTTTLNPVARDSLRRLEFRIELPDGLSFIERVGFRYALDKSLRASAAAVCWRSADARPGEPRWLPYPADDAGRAESAPLLEYEPRDQDLSAFTNDDPDSDDALVSLGPLALPLTLRKSATVVDLLRGIGARKWFTPLDSRDEVERVAGLAATTIPTMTLEVVDRRPVGPRAVFDLSVADLHAFVAGTVAVHNCIGNSGPLSAEVSQAITDGELVAAAVLSGNRNFEGRIQQDVRANYLASPPLVVAYALAGTVDIDLARDPLGIDKDGQPVLLSDLWPSQQEIRDTIARALKPEHFAEQYANVFDGNPRWNEIPVSGGERYRWDPASTYIHEPPFFQDLTPELAPLRDIQGARVLVMVGDSVTTDHISPAGDIARVSPAGKWLEERGVEKKDFNSYGSRRGNDLVMVRGTFANIRLKNLLVPGSEGNVTAHWPSGDKTSIYEAAERYREESVPLLVLAGKEYGTGSSRDWAAKGTLLMGVRAVLAESYERIHRSNLVGMGVLPIQYDGGQTAESLGLTGREAFDVIGIAQGLAPRKRVTLRARRDDGSMISFEAVARLDTPVEVEYYRNGGILQTVLRRLMRA